MHGRADARLAMCCRETSSTSPSKRVDVRHARFAHRCRASSRQLAVAVERVPSSRFTSRRSGRGLVLPADEHETLVGEVRQRRRRARRSACALNVQRTGRFPSSRRTGSAPTTTPVSVAPANAGIAGQRRVDAEVRAAVRGDEKRAVHESPRGSRTRLSSSSGSVGRGRGGTLVGSSRLALDRVVAERAVGRQRQRPFGAAPLAELDCALVDARGPGCRAAQIHQRAGAGSSMPRGVSRRRIALKWTSSPRR